jgi:hypothetical protein
MVELRGMLAGGGNGSPKAGRAVHKDASLIERCANQLELLAGRLEADEHEDAQARGNSRAPNQYQFQGYSDLRQHDDY